MKKFIFTAVYLMALTACQTASQHAPTQTVSQTNPAWDTQYGGADKSYDSELLKMREIIAPQFQVFEFVDKSGVKITYNLYTPKNLDPNKKYPLVMFIADASTAGKGAKAPLMQGWGGIIWASEESQAKNPAFVLVPAYDTKATSDDWQTSNQVKVTPNLVREIAKKYPIDSKRLYTTGQSMGGMISFYLNSIEPDLFAASMFVGSQWDINVLEPLTRAKFIYTVSAADPKASVGMKEVIELMNKNGVQIAETEFSAKLPQAEQNQAVAKMLAENKSANFIRFTPNTVVPQGNTHKGGEHMYSFDYAYKLSPAREWLFKQSR
ncbi:Putative esterase [Moraxella cuniculi DSM 21768]|uniref:Putative esterase n=1 Tax=Moraxella cuniculi DSM 21768 TaxID=1122245 RepID=A0A1N7FUR9_9GAMM|nr:alpha/beta hydrolase-fold protein [Moraxella cuniculi]OOS05479.1 pyrroline-5-carboxylate reductase [Moraxella cuniculi]SIS04108.1 Putative esterase [Moraxella cuniculi DSM 21768]